MIRLVVDAADADAARAQVEEMCERLLANPVIEAYEVDDLERWIAASRERRASASCSSRAPTASSTSCGRSSSSAATAELLLARRRRRCSGVDAVVVPGGFAHGDYLRTGAIARFSPVMDAVARVRGRRRSGRRHLQRLPGAHRGAAAARRAAEERGPEVPVRDRRAAGRDDVDRAHRTRATSGDVLRVPINHFEGNYVCDDATRSRELRAEDRVVVRYVDNPNGSLDDIAGICNEGRNVVGLMPHPERAS